MLPDAHWEISPGEVLNFGVGSPERLGQGWADSGGHLVGGLG